MQQTIHLDDRLQVPRLGFGTFRLAGDAAYRSVGVALDAGYRHIDTAQGYGNEAEVGRAIAASDVAPLEETLTAMTEVLESGRTRAIGVSNFPSAMLARAFDLAPIVTDQVEHHPYLGVDPIEAVLGERGGFLTAYSPLAQGEVADDPTLQEIGEAHGVSPAQLTLRWLLQKPATVAIPKSGTPERIRANIDLFGFELSDDEVARITALDRGRRIVDPPGGPDWD